MAFRPPHSREKAPQCDTCGAANPHAVPQGDGFFRWACAACEYRAAHPDAPLIPTVPRERRALLLQKVSLF